jgi:hypothetical protein
LEQRSIRIAWWYGSPRLAASTSSYTTPPQGASSLHIAPTKSAKHSAGECVRAGVHTNAVGPCSSVLSWQLAQLPVKHLPKYLDEMSFRFNNWRNPYLFCDTPLRLIGSEALPYHQLIKIRLKEV